MIGERFACEHGYFDTEDCPKCPPKPSWGIWDAWRGRLVGLVPFRSKADAESYAEFGNTAEGEKRYEARELT